MNCLQHRNKHESISHKEQQTGVLCCGFKSVFRGSGGLSAWAVLERWSVDELHGQAVVYCSLFPCLGHWRPTAESLVLWRSKKELILDNWLIFQGLPKYACHAWWSSYVLQNIFWELVFQSTLVNWNQGLSKNKPKQTRGIYIFIPFLFLKQTNKHNHKITSAQKVHSLGKRKVLGWTLPAAV